MNQAEALTLIRSLLPSLKGVELKLGNYILTSPEEFTNMTTARLANHLRVSEGSIIRFCRKLGYEGFTALKIGVARSIQAKNLFVLGDISIGTDQDVFSVTTQVFDSVSRVLHETLGILDRDAMTRAAERIRNASRIEFYGLGTSAPIVQDAYYRFMRIGLNAAACVDPYIMNVSASLMQPGCLAIAISHTGRSIQTVEALKLAKEHGADTLCITSYMDSPVTRFADIALVTSPCGSGDLREATITRIAHIALLDSLCTYIAMSERERTAAGQDELQKLLEKQRY